jgi:pimeloyl-ACP methyl ester carboxylesterase
MKVFHHTRLACLLSAMFYCFSSVAFAEGEQVISYTDIGQGTPLVLIHAFPSDKQIWEPQQALQKNFRVITLDLWGFGQSTPVELFAVNMENYANEVKKLLDQLHIDKAIIGGESMGGYIALAFLKQYPNNVAGLILSDTQSIADSEEMKATREKNADAVLQNGTGDMIQKFLPTALSPTAPDQTRKFLESILSTQTKEAVAYSLRGMALREDTSSVLSTTSLPVLIITGDQDTLISPEQSQAMHVLAKNSNLVIIKNAGHLSNLEQPEQWNQAVITLFGERK